MFFISIAPKIDANNYGEFVDVTNYVDASSLSDIEIDTFANDYGTGIAATNSIDLSLLNIDGRFSDEFSNKSMFTYSRNNSQVKIEWFERGKPARLGQAILGIDVLGDTRIQVFSGLIDEISPRENIQTKYVDMTVVGKESILENVTIVDGDITTLLTASGMMAQLLNKQEIKNVLSISPESEWELGHNFTYTDILDFEDVTTVKEALDIILEHTNSVLSIIDDVIYISDRVETSELKYTFNAPHVEGAVDNIISIEDISTGINRTFNLWSFEDDTQDAGIGFDPVSESIVKYGIRKGEISEGSINNSDREDILSTYYGFYEYPKKEISLSTALNKDSVLLKQFDKVLVNYPIKVIYQGKQIPRWSAFEWGANIEWPLTDNSYFLPKNTYFKIIKLSYNLLKETLTIKLREI